MLLVFVAWLVFLVFLAYSSRLDPNQGFDPRFFAIADRLACIRAAAFSSAERAVCTWPWAQK